MRAPAFVVTLALATLTARADVAQPARAVDLPLFEISKSENKNRVVYALHLDERCAPEAPAPLRAYWRMLERGPRAYEPLLAREEPAYGLARQAVKGDVVRASLRALPDRELTVITWRAGDACAAAAWTEIAGTRARLAEVHVVLAWPFGVSRIVMRGQTRAGAWVEETLPG